MSRIESIQINNCENADQDVNAYLTELDKGLRSCKLGDQCEAVVRFPMVFEKYPFPILINSSFLKLAEFFRCGSNLLRLWVLRVCEQNEKHLDKILNVDEFVKRIFTVMHTNDPIARSLALRTLGAVAGVIPEKQQVHHAIRSSLDSHDSIEVEAAIRASAQFAAQSKSFAISMCSKMASMIESLQIPINMKLQVIPVLRHMHHDAKTAALVRKLCTELLPKYPAEEFIIVILDSLTHLSLATLVDIPEQVTLLLKYLQDLRKRVRYSILRSMQYLARKGAHLWPNGAMHSLLEKAMACTDQGEEKWLVLSVVRLLTECPVTCNALLLHDQEILLDMCAQCLVLEDPSAASQALRILTGIVTYCYSEQIVPPPNYMAQIDIHHESFIYLSLSENERNKELQVYLLCGVKLSEKNVEFADRFVHLIGGILTDDFAYPLNNTLSLTKTLGALCSQFLKRKFNNNQTSRRASTTSEQPVDSFDHLIPPLIRRLDMLLDRKSAGDIPQIEILSTVCLQAMLGCVLPRPAIDCFEKLMFSVSFWTLYRVARSASRYGHHYLAARIYTRIASRISIDKLHFFLSALAQISMAECVLVHGHEFHVINQDYAILLQSQHNEQSPKTRSLAERLEIGIGLYWKALATLKASSTTEHPLTFQIDYVRLRGQFLETLHGIVIIKNTQNIAPPPAIAHTLAANSRDYLQKFGHVTNQLRKMVKSIKMCEEAYGKLYKSVFDADICTLEYLEITKTACIILGHTVETICFSSPSDMPVFPADSHYPETSYLISTCQKMKREISTLPVPEPGVQKLINTKHTDTIVRQIELFLGLPTCLPRFYFQVLQSTNIKLSFSPQSRVAGEPIVVLPGSGLVVKIEGLIENTGRKASLFRSIESVQFTLTAQLISTKNPQQLMMCGEYIKPSSDTIQLTQTVKPHRDFLSVSFLVPLNNGPVVGGLYNGSGGNWQITVETFVVDGNSVLWNTGPQCTMLVHVPDDPNKVTSSGGRRY